MTYQTDEKPPAPFRGAPEPPTGLVSAHPHISTFPLRGFVYFVLATRSAIVKIGRAAEPWKRLSTMQSGSPEELGMLGVIDTYLPRTLERDLHAAFAKDHVRGEWFELTEELLDYAIKWSSIDR